MGWVCCERGILRICGKFMAADFTDVASRYHIYANDIAARSHLYDIYIYAYLKKFHPAGSQETKHIAHAQRETK